MNQKAFDVLLECVGKTIQWVGFDQESEAYIVIFSDKTALLVPEFEAISDVDLTAQTLLRENLAMSQQVVKLFEMFPPKKAEGVPHEPGDTGNTKVPETPATT